MFEGFQSAPYLDTLGVWTIGYGATVWLGKRVTQATRPVSITEAQVGLKADVLDAITGCQRLYRGTFDHLSDVQQEVLVHMAFQLGTHKLSKFKRMNKAVKKDDKDAWVYEMQDSKWWHQTPRPAKALAAAISHGEWQGRWKIK